MSTHPDISLPLTPGCIYHIYNRGNEKRSIFFERKNYFFFLRKIREYMEGFVDVYAYCLLNNHFHLCIKVKPVEEVIKRASDVGFSEINSLFYRRYVLPWFVDIPRGGLTVLPIWKDVDIASKLPHISHYSISELKELLNLIPPPVETPLQDHPLKLEDLHPINQLTSYIVSERFRRFLLSYAKSINKDIGRTGSLFQKAFRRKWVPTTIDAKRVINYIHHNPIHHGYTKDFDTYDWSSYETFLEDSFTSLDRNTVLEWFGGREQFIDEALQYKTHRWTDEQFYIEET